MIEICHLKKSKLPLEKKTLLKHSAKKTFEC